MHLLVLLLCLFGSTFANTEIRHVVGPSTSSISIKALNHLRSRVSTLPNTAFIQHYAKFDVDHPELGKVISLNAKSNANSTSEQWYILNTIPLKRYEIRISYPAINPTDFEIDTFEPSVILREWNIKDTSSSDRVNTSILFIRIRAVAMGISTSSPQANVGYNIIADEMVFNLFPPVIFPLFGAILLVVVVSWFILFPICERPILYAWISGDREKRLIKGQTRNEFQMVSYGHKFDTSLHAFAHHDSLWTHRFGDLRYMHGLDEGDLHLTMAFLGH